MKKALLLTCITVANSGMKPPAQIFSKNPESLQTLCLKHFLYNAKEIKDIQLKRILSREKMDPFEEYENLFKRKIGPETLNYLQILLFNNLKPDQDYPMLSMLTQLWPNAEPLTTLHKTLLLIIEKGFTTTTEICVALHLILNQNTPHPRFTLAEFLMEKGLSNNLNEYFELYPNSLRIWRTINYGNLTHDMQQFLKKVASAKLPRECQNSFLRLAAQRRILHKQTEYDPMIESLIKNGADLSILSPHEQNQLLCANLIK